MSLENITAEESRRMKAAHRAIAKALSKNLDGQNINLSATVLVRAVAFMLANQCKDAEEIVEVANRLRTLIIEEALDMQNHMGKSA